MTDAGAAAVRLLAADLADLGAEPVPIEPSSAARDWALSGALELTGRRDGPPRLAPGAPASWMRAAVSLMGIQAELPDPAALLSERAACAGRTRNAPRSVGGAFRSLRAADGWLGLSLARDSDFDCLPALVEASVAGDPWRVVENWLGVRSVGAAADRAQLLGLPAAVVPATPTPPSRHAVEVTLGPSARSTRVRPVVLDFSALWSGPLCAHLLGLNGARVIKVESRDRPDGARRGPARFYDLLHGGHEAVALDFTDRHDRAALTRLIARADVVVEASRPRALRQLGIDAVEYARASTVWVAISAYGRDNPDRVGFGDDVAAAAGLVVDDGDGPYPVGDAIADPLAGVAAAAAATVALRAGRGCLLDVSMCAVAAYAAGLPSEDAVVGTSSEGWIVDVGGNRLPVRLPRARAVTTKARALGADTRAVLAEFE